MDNRLFDLMDSFCDEHEEYEMYGGYSGRGMCGDRCPGISFSGYTLSSLARCLAHTCWKTVWMTSGKSCSTFWPALQVSEYKRTGRTDMG